MFDKTQAMAPGEADGLASPSDSDEEDRDTGYTSMIKRHYKHILERPRVENSKVARRADIISYFFDNPSLLKLHDFLPDHFILAINEKECKNAHQLTQKRFCQLLEEPRDQVLVDQINSFFQKNPIQTSDENATYYNLMTDDTMRWLKSKFDDFPRLRNTVVDDDQTMTEKEKRDLMPANVCRFVRSLHDDEDSYAYLNTYAIFILPLNRLLTLSQILVELDIVIKKTRDPAKFNLNWRDLRALIENYKLQPKYVNFADYIPLKS
jgi:hypothetical protein